MKVIKILFIKPRIEEKVSAQVLEDAMNHLETPCMFTVVNNGFIALERLEVSVYDIIIVNSEMKYLSGPNFVQIVKNLGMNPQIIYLLPKDKDIPLHNTPYPVLYSPFTYTELRSSIRKEILSIESRMSRSAADIDGQRLMVKRSRLQPSFEIQIPKVKIPLSLCIFSPTKKLSKAPPKKRGRKPKTSDPLASFVKEERFQFSEADFESFHSYRMETIEELDEESLSEQSGRMNEDDSIDFMSICDLTLNDESNKEIQEWRRMLLNSMEFNGKDENAI